MDPTKWGPGLWIFLHSITFNYPTKPTWTEKKIMNDFLTQLQYILPCVTCRTHYKDYILTHKPQLETRSEFVVWMIQLHNTINKRYGKRVWSVDEVVEFYKKYYDNTIQQTFTDTSKKTFSFSSFCNSSTMRIIFLVSIFWLFSFVCYQYALTPVFRLK